MTSHSCVQHLLGCKSFLGFPRASGRCSCHWVDCLMGMWHLYAPASGAKYTLELFLKYCAFPPLSRKCVRWPASWGVKCPMPFLFWPLEKKTPVSRLAHSSALQTCWPPQASPMLWPTASSKQVCISRVCLLAFSFFSLLCLSCWFNPVRPSHSVKAPFPALQSNPLLLPLFLASPFQNNRPKPSAPLWNVPRLFPSLLWVAFRCCLNI